MNVETQYMYNYLRERGKEKNIWEYTYMNMYNYCNIPIGTPLKVKIRVEYKRVATYRKMIEMEFISETSMYMVL